MKNEDNKSNTGPSKDCVLTALDLGNFKAFAETQHLPIKPLTLIFGANSSGKSSLIHSLLLANHALANGNVDVHQPRLAGQSVDLGGFHEFVHQHEVERGCTLAFTIYHKPYEITTSFGGFARTTLRFEIGKATCGDSCKERSDLVGVSSFSMEADGQHFLSASRSGDGSFRFGRFNFDHPCFVQFFKRIDQSRPPLDPDDLRTANTYYAKLKERIEQNPDWVNRETDERWIRDHEREIECRSDILGQLRIEFIRTMSEIPLHPDNLIPVRVGSKGLREDQGLEEAFGSIWNIGTDFPPSCSIAVSTIASILRFGVEKMLDWINFEFSRLLDRLTYLGPLRCYPPRQLTGMHDQDPNWFSGGGRAWDILRRNQEVAKKVNHWLGSLQGQNTHYEINIRCLKDLGLVGPDEKKRLAERLQQVGANDETSALASVDALLADLAGEPMGMAFSEITLLDRRTGLELSHRDVGVGISQVLPVLVHAYANQNQIVAIEQPEIHLHPALQAELGDVFIESALGERKNTFILETHSEHLILRIMRRMRETHQKKLPEGLPPIFPKDVAIIFVERDGSRSIVREMPLDEMGRLVKAWPGGFFEESFNELF